MSFDFLFSLHKIYLTLFNELGSDSESYEVIFLWFASKTEEENSIIGHGSSSDIYRDR